MPASTVSVATPNARLLAVPASIRSHGVNIWYIITSRRNRKARSTGLGLSAFPTVPHLPEVPVFNSIFFVASQLRCTSVTDDAGAGRLAIERFDWEQADWIGRHHEH